MKTKALPSKQTASEAITPASEPREDTTAIEQALVANDLSRLGPDQRLQYYRSICDSLKLNPLTNPFAYITLEGKLRLYATKDCAEQLRRRDGIKFDSLTREIQSGCYVVIAKASDNAGRSDEAMGAVSVEGLKGQSLANAMMKAETKAKRRVTMSIAGLGMPSDDDVDSIRESIGAAQQSQADPLALKDGATIEEMIATYEKRGSEAEAKEPPDAIEAQRNYELADMLRAKLKEQHGEALKNSGSKAKAKPQPITVMPTEETWQDIVSHIGSAMGPLGKKLGELMGHEVSYATTSRWLDYFEDRVKKIPTLVGEDLALSKALAFARNTLPAKKAREAMAAQQGQAGKAEEARPEVIPPKQPIPPTKPASATVDPQLDDSAGEANEPPKLTEWRDVKVPESIKSKAIAGKRLGALPVNYIRAIKLQILDVKDMETPEEKLFAAAMAIALEELKIDQPDEVIQEALRERVQDLIIPEADFVTSMKQWGEIEPGNSPIGARIADLPAWEIQNLLSAWPDISAKIRAEEQERAKASKPPTNSGRRFSK